MPRFRLKRRPSAPKTNAVDLKSTLNSYHAFIGKFLHLESPPAPIKKELPTQKPIKPDDFTEGHPYKGEKESKQDFEKRLKSHAERKQKSKEAHDTYKKEFKKYETIEGENKAAAEAHVVKVKSTETYNKEFKTWLKTFNDNIVPAESLQNDPEYGRQLEILAQSASRFTAIILMEKLDREESMGKSASKFISKHGYEPIKAMKEILKNPDVSSIEAIKNTLKKITALEKDTGFAPIKNLVAHDSIGMLNDEHVKLIRQLEFPNLIQEHIIKLDQASNNIVEKINRTIKEIVHPDNKGDAPSEADRKIKLQLALRTILTSIDPYSVNGLNQDTQIINNRLDLEEKSENTITDPELILDFHGAANDFAAAIKYAETKLGPNSILFKTGKEENTTFNDFQKQIEETDKAVLKLPLPNANEPDEATFKKAVNSIRTALQIHQKKAIEIENAILTAQKDKNLSTDQVNELQINLQVLKDHISAQTNIVSREISQREEAKQIAQQKTTFGNLNNEISKLNNTKINIPSIDSTNFAAEYKNSNESLIKLREKQKEIIESVNKEISKPGVDKIIIQQFKNALTDLEANITQKSGSLKQAKDLHDNIHAPILLAISKTKLITNQIPDNKANNFTEQLNLAQKRLELMKTASENFSLLVKEANKTSDQEKILKKDIEDLNSEINKISNVLARAQTNKQKQIVVDIFNAGINSEMKKVITVPSINLPIGLFDSQIQEATKKLAEWKKTHLALKNNIPEGADGSALESLNSAITKKESEIAAAIELNLEYHQIASNKEAIIISTKRIPVSTLSAKEFKTQFEAAQKTFNNYKEQNSTFEKAQGKGKTPEQTSIITTALKERQDALDSFEKLLSKAKQEHEKSQEKLLEQFQTQIIQVQTQLNATNFSPTKDSKDIAQEVLAFRSELTQLQTTANSIRNQVTTSGLSDTRIATLNTALTKLDEAIKNKMHDPAIMRNAIVAILPNTLKTQITISDTSPPDEKNNSTFSMNTNGNFHLQEALSTILNQPPEDAAVVKNITGDINSFLDIISKYGTEFESLYKVSLLYGIKPTNLEKDIETSTKLISDIMTESKIEDLDNKVKLLEEHLTKNTDALKAVSDDIMFKDLDIKNNQSYIDFSKGVIALQNNIATLKYQIALHKLPALIEATIPQELKDLAEYKAEYIGSITINSTQNGLNFAGLNDFAFHNALGSLGLGLYASKPRDQALTNEDKKFSIGIAAPDQMYQEISLHGKNVFKEIFIRDAKFMLDSEYKKQEALLRKLPTDNAALTKAIEDDPAYSKAFNTFKAFEAGIKSASTVAHIIALRKEILTIPELITLMNTRSDEITNNHNNLNQLANDVTQFIRAANTQVSNIEQVYIDSKLKINSNDLNPLLFNIASQFIGPTPTFVYADLRSRILALPNDQRDILVGLSEAQKKLSNAYNGAKQLITLQNTVDTLDTNLTNDLRTLHNAINPPPPGTIDFATLSVTTDAIKDNLARYQLQKTALDNEINGLTPTISNNALQAISFGINVVQTKLESLQNALLPDNIPEPPPPFPPIISEAELYIESAEAQMRGITDAYPETPVLDFDPTNLSDEVSSAWNNFFIQAQDEYYQDLITRLERDLPGQTELLERLKEARKFLSQTYNIANDFLPLQGEIQALYTEMDNDIGEITDPTLPGPDLINKVDSVTAKIASYENSITQLNDQLANFPHTPNVGPQYLSKFVAELTPKLDELKNVIVNANASLPTYKSSNTLLEQIAQRLGIRGDAGFELTQKTVEKILNIEKDLTTALTDLDNAQILPARTAFETAKKEGVIKKATAAIHGVKYRLEQQNNPSLDTIKAVMATFGAEIKNENSRNSDPNVQNQIPNMEPNEQRKALKETALLQQFAALDNMVQDLDAKKINFNYLDRSVIIPVEEDAAPHLQKFFSDKEQETFNKFIAHAKGTSAGTLKLDPTAINRIGEGKKEVGIIYLAKYDSNLSIAANDKKIADSAILTSTTRNTATGDVEMELSLSMGLDPKIILANAAKTVLTNSGITDPTFKPTTSKPFPTKTTDDFIADMVTLFKRQRKELTVENMQAYFKSMGKKGDGKLDFSINQKSNSAFSSNENILAKHLEQALKAAMDPKTLLVAAAKIARQYFDKLGINIDNPLKLADAQMAIWNNAMPQPLIKALADYCAYKGANFVDGSGYGVVGDKNVVSKLIKESKDKIKGDGGAFEHAMNPTLNITTAAINASTLPSTPILNSAFEDMRKTHKADGEIYAKVHDEIRAKCRLPRKDFDNLMQTGLPNQLAQAQAELKTNVTDLNQLVTPILPNGSALGIQYAQLAAAVRNSQINMNALTTLDLSNFLKEPKEDLAKWQTMQGTLNANFQQIQSQLKINIANLFNFINDNVANGNIKPVPASLIQHMQVIKNFHTKVDLLIEENLNIPKFKEYYAMKPVELEAVFKKEINKELNSRHEAAARGAAPNTPSRSSGIVTLTAGNIPVKPALLIGSRNAGAPHNSPPVGNPNPTPPPRRGHSR